jgi:hypothetical protein
MHPMNKRGEETSSTLFNALKTAGIILVGLVIIGGLAYLLSKIELFG